ncbi:hypothetical protein Poli38472_010562 [Pythium oligandrum]|uniref:Rab-GAP TBC domain-containing protein n=1 Tax=Pythium oligandrum TaxID=41045 RepID=A0A8K1F9X3_PYTOL|nr:hypothetical protein Poli38472_010562 [Pythium oligandrum]|eukprot:TMW55680.1 hypothetical protein Poli38472_010562 [Pythium oligandrum]
MGRQQVDDGALLSSAQENAERIVSDKNGVERMCASIPTSPVPKRAETTKKKPVHGRRLSCFRPRQRFTCADANLTPLGNRLVCGCDYTVLPCRVPTSSMSNELEAQYARHKKWADKFDAQDWGKQKAACQKWRENEQKFRLVAQKEDGVVDAEQESRMSPSKTSAGFKNALSTIATAAEGRILSTKFDNLVRAGVPSHMRGQVWWVCSGAAEKREAASACESYPALIKRVPQLSKKAAMEIEKDLPRTFPTEPAVPNDEELRVKNMVELRRILQAYCLRNPAIGYCQSMNFLGSILLQHMEEEEAFWVLVTMVEDLLPQYHTRSMVGSRAEQRVFSELIQQKLPAVHQHMEKLGVNFEPFTLKWFLCAFLNTLPMETVLRIWDILFCEGSYVLLRIGLALLKLNQPRILACDDAIDIYEMLKFTDQDLYEITAPQRTGILNRDDCVCDTLIRLAMDKSFIGQIGFDTLHEIRQLYRNEIAAETKAAEERRTVRSTQSVSLSATSLTCDEADCNDGEDVNTPLGRKRQEEAEQELAEYDFVEEYAYHCGDVSPTKHIHFRPLFVTESSDYFIDVDYERRSSLSLRSIKSE